MNNHYVVVVWRNFPNDLNENLLYSAYFDEAMEREDAFVNTVPCWMIHRNANF